MDILCSFENLSRLEINKLEIRLTKDIDSFLALESEWNRMVAENFGGHPFLSHFWFTNYYGSYYRQAPLMILTVHEDGDVIIAGLPMVATRRRMAGIPLKEARLLAGAHSHINRVLVSEKHQKAMPLLMQKLIKEGVDLIYFEDVPQDFPDKAWMEGFCRQEKLLLEIRTVRRSPFIPTTGSFEEYRKNLSKKFRELLNNRLNRINRAGGFEIKVFKHDQDYEEAINDMRSIARNSWQGKNRSGIFSGADNDHFYSHLIGHSLRKSYGRVFILYFEGIPAAFEYHIYYGLTEYCLKSEFSLRFEKLTPGGVLDLELVRRAFSSEVKVYDLLGFEDTYKLRWTKNVTTYNRYFIFNHTAAGKTAHLLYYRLGNRLRESKLLRRMKERMRKG